MQHGPRRGRSGVWLLLAVAACAPRAGWQRDTTRTCEPRQPAVVCVRAWPDRGAVVEVGGTRIVPGECVVAPRGGGRVAVVWREPDGARSEQAIRARAGRRTELALGAGGDLDVSASMRCDRAMPPWDHP